MTAVTWISVIASPRLFVVIVIDIHIPDCILADLALDSIARQVGPLEGRTILIAGVGRMGRIAAIATRKRTRCTTRKCTR
jgi:hypothetical protein